MSTARALGERVEPRPAAPKRPEIDLSVVIPAYNEADWIGPTITRVLEYLRTRSWTFDVLVVVDGSRDRTDDVVRQIAEESPEVALVTNPINRGKGFSVRRGMLAARGRVVLFSDADLSTPIEEVERLIAALDDGHEVAIGSRGLATSDVRVRQPIWRQSMGRIFNWFVQRIALPRIWDSQCGFKCFPREVALQLFTRQRIDRFGFDVEILWIARRLGYRIAEVPVTWTNRPQSKVHPVRDSAWMLFDLFRIRFNDWRGAYR